MSLKQSTGVLEEEKKMTEKKKGEEAVMTARSTETEEAKAETWRFKPKQGSVIPKKRRLVQSMMLDYAQHKLTGSGCSSAQSSSPGDSNRVYPNSSNHAD
ncbi:hypothetical protein TIFTF001_019515 [Ficus carica]|uniref:Uncharacterized protein n=1 Tax=Ficus carica TaxID=3494 RepID=A0AA88AD54_FICCA|nr:hypothetical protein TIFTF001_019515 [Ficus carica]